MKSKEKIAINIRYIKKYNKPWVFISPLYNHTTCPKCGNSYTPTDWELVPSFEDNMRMLFAYGYCEDRKYPNGKGRHMITELVQALMEYNPEPDRWDDVWIDLCQRFDIPLRDDRGNHE